MAKPPGIARYSTAIQAKKTIYGMALQADHFFMWIYVTNRLLNQLENALKMSVFISYFFFKFRDCWILF